MYPSLKELQRLVIQWAKEKGLLTDVTIERMTAQAEKVIEELGETSGAYLKHRMDDFKDGVGDTAVTLIILAEMCGVELDKEAKVPEHVPSKIMIISRLVGSFYLDNILRQKPVIKSDCPLSFAFAELKLLAESQGLTLEECLVSAYLVISKRTGKMVGDSFVKD